MTPSIWQLLIVLVIVLLLFGRGKIPQLMGDMAKGIKSFKRGMDDEEKKDDIEKKSDEENNINVFFWLVRDSACNSGSGYCCWSKRNT